MIRVVLAILLIAPWLLPPGWGPSPAVLPWLLSLASCGIAIALLSLQQLRFNDLWPLIAKAWLVAAALSSVIGLCQLFGLEHHFSPWMSLSETGQAFANLRQRNQFASLTQIGVLCALVLAVRSANANALQGLQWPGLVFLGVLLALGNAAASSRTGFLEMLLIVFLAWRWSWLKHSRAKALLICVVIAYVCGALFLPALAGLGDNNDLLARMRDGGPSCATRLNLWRTVLYLIAEKPWTGWGWGELDFAHFMTLGSDERFCEILGNAHNLPLHFAVELGIPAAVVICASLFFWVVRGRPWQETCCARQLAWGVLGLLTLHSLLEYPLWYGPFAMALLVCLALLHQSRHQSEQGAHHQGLQDAEEIRSIRSIAYRFIATLIIACVLYAGWDYQRITQLYLRPEQRSLGYRTDPLQKARASWLFRNQVEFADLSLTTPTSDNARQVNAQAHALMHYSPEASVVEKLIESAALLKKDEEVTFYRVRYQAAYPAQYQDWMRSVSMPQGTSAR